MFVFNDRKTNKVSDLVREGSGPEHHRSGVLKTPPPERFG
jgi:hypothetical protein